MDYAPRNEDFAAKLALTYAELFDGVSPLKQRVSLRVAGDVLELKNVETHAVSRWSLADIREVPDQSDGEALMLAPSDADPARLLIREVEAIRALVETGAPMPPLSGPTGQLKRLGIMGVLAAACFSGLLFGLVPWFADRAAAHIPPEAEVALGRELFDTIYTARGASECRGPAGIAALEKMEARLIAGFDLPVPLEVRVVRHPEINATATMGGQVTLHSALLAAAETPDEVAAVLAHEIGHVANRDVTRAQLRAMGSYGLIGLLFGDVTGLSAAAGVTTAVVDASYSRAAEAEADAYAFRMMADAGLSPAALGSFFARLEASGETVELGVFRHLSSHPELMGRIQAAEAAGAAAPSTGSILSDAEWAALQSICQSGGGLPPEKD
ncbi:MAG: M48 family metallopeptidase [Pseudomonadota bacterium]